MAKIYKCDRCDKEVKGIDLTEYSFRSKEYALCYECSDNLDKILVEINKTLDKQMEEFLNNGHTENRTPKRPQREDNN